ncbi:MAG: hypothetical protein FWE59_07110 [Oscillospiraceae bacterium]|nr:hypothetical protein [Oscillospiraceae bacterium]
MLKRRKIIALTVVCALLVGAAYAAALGTLDITANLYIVPSIDVQWDDTMEGGAGVGVDVAEITSVTESVTGEGYDQVTVTALFTEWEDEVLFTLPIKNESSVPVDVYLRIDNNDEDVVSTTIVVPASIAAESSENALLTITWDQDQEASFLPAAALSDPPVIGDLTGGTPLTFTIVLEYGLTGFTP